MSKRRRPALAAVELEPRLTPSVSTQVRNFEAITEGSNAGLTAFYNGLYYFSARSVGTSSEGGDIYVTDLTPAGTHFLMDVVPEPVYSGAVPFAFNNQLFIRTYKEIGSEYISTLYVSDGTVAGTHEFLDSNGNPCFFGETAQGNINGLKYFQGNDSAHGHELWRSDGTSAGTYMVSDIYPGTASSSPGLFCNVNGIVYFTADDGVHARELWRTDGTSSGTQLVRDIRPIADIDPPRDLVNVNGTLFFNANDNVTGYELWKSDGTSEGTVLIKDINPGLASSVSFYSIALGNRLLFSANDGVHGNELWISDGTSNGTQLIADFIPGGGSFGTFYFTQFQGLIYFAGRHSLNPTQSGIWRTDGTSSGTMLVCNLDPSGYEPGRLQVFNNTLYFMQKDTEHGREPWMSDGTSSGTRMIADINPGGAWSDPYFTGFFNNRIWISADDGQHGGELWSSDGTSSGTQLLLDINTTTDPTSISNFSRVGGAEYFRANDVLWRSNGTSSGTQFVFSSYQGFDSSNGVMDVNGMLFFDSSDNNYHGKELWASDGTSTGSYLVRDIRPGSSNSGISQMTNMGGVAYFTANDGTSGFELWRSDGTSAGTRLVVPDVNSASSNPTGLTPVGNRLYFSANNSGVKGLWSSDGTSTGTQLVRAFTPALSSLTNVNGTLYFVSNGREIWRTDGTSAGTTLVRAFASSSGFGNLSKVGSVLYFTASESASGVELWRSDGTISGTFRVGDINPGAAGSNPGKVVAVGPLAYFPATSGTAGTELWVSDGTVAGTRKVQTIAAASGQANSLMNADGMLFFLANDGVNGLEVWQSNGTPAGTVLRELAPGAASANPANLFTLGRKAFVTTPGENSSQNLLEIHATPVLTLITTPSPNGTATTGQTIEITLSFSVPVTLSGGPLQVTLNTGAVVSVGPFSGTTATALYTIAAGQTHPRLDVTGLSLGAGATLMRDGAAVDLTLPAANLAVDRNIVVNPPPPTTVSGTFVNLGATQRSRLTSITLNFSQPVNVGVLTGPGVITLTKTAGPNLGTIVQTGASGANGRIKLLPASGMMTSLTLVFENANGAAVTAGVENGSLSDGRWRLSIPYLSYQSNLNDPNLRRLFGDVNNDGTVDGTDLAAFGAAFGQTNFNSPFDFDANGTVDAADYAAFGSRFGVTM